jgi:hypothetical protein
MTLDHDTGEMDGSVLAGDFARQQFRSLNGASLQDLVVECHASDSDGARLLEAYLNRQFPH